VEGGAPNEERKQDAAPNLPLGADRFAELRAAWPRPWIDHDEEEARGAFARACAAGAEPGDIVAGAHAWAAAVEPRDLPKLSAWLDGQGWRKRPPARRRRSESDRSVYRKPNLADVMGELAEATQ